MKRIKTDLRWVLVVVVGVEGENRNKLELVNCPSSKVVQAEVRILPLCMYIVYISYIFTLFSIY